MASDAKARLGQTQVIALADAYAKREGYRLKDYTRSTPRYHADIHGWIVIYTPKGRPRMLGDDFSVHVDDHTKKPLIIPGR